MGAPIWFAIAVLAGALVAAQGPIYARMSAALGGPVQTVLTAFVTAALSMAVIAAVSGGWPKVADLRAMPVWVWAGGILGIVVVAVSSLAVPRLGASAYLVALVAGQMIAGALYDRTGAFGLPPRMPGAVNWAGLGLIVLGAALATSRRG